MEDQSLRDFVAEAEDLLENLEESIGALMDIDPGDHRKPEVINAVFRQAHSLKGLSSMFNLENVSGVSHRIENLLDGLRLGRISLSGGVLDIIGQGIQILIRMVRSVSEGGTDGSVDYASFLQELGVFEEGSRGRGEEDLSSFIDVPAGLEEMLSEYEEHRFRDNIERGVPLFRVTCSLPLETFDVELQQLGSSIREIGELVTTLPETSPGKENRIGFILYFASGVDEKRVREIIGTHEKGLTRVACRSAAAVSAPKPTAGELPQAAPERDHSEEDVKGFSNTVRVDIEKLNLLMNLVGELVVIKSGLSMVSARIRGEEGSPGKGQAGELEKSLLGLEKKLTDLRDAVMDVRMVPMGQLFTRLQRVCKKISRELGKKVDLEFAGHDTELDKLLMEAIVPPLLHIVRNALDHGIEEAGVRRARGKKEVGKVMISALQQGNGIVLEVMDDGGGIDVDVIRDIAVRKGFAASDAALDVEDVLDFLFAPGFSTKEGITELSGRGVGMDVVKTELEKVGGTVRINTVKGHGTRITLTVPITLAILQALLIGSSGRIYAVPLGSIQETVELKEGQIRTIEGREVMLFRDRTVPLIRLEELFGFPRIREAGQGFVVVISMAGRTMGLLAADLLGKQEIVIKPLGEYLSGNPGLAGAAEMGDQSTVLVLDVAGLMAQCVRMGQKGGSW